jgi:hypothetical protein
MNKQTKILIGLGIIGIAVYYFYRKSFKNGVQQVPKEESQGESTSYVDGVIERPFPIVKYKFVKPFSVNWFSTPTIKGTKTFNIGDVIETKMNREFGNSLVTYTQLNGTAPDFDMDGQPWLEIPINVLEEVNTQNFTGNNNFFATHSQNCSGLNCA